MRWPTAALLAPVLTGCSFIYNPNNLPNPPGEAGIDAAPDASIVRDANECMLALTDITPAIVNEGQGDGNSAPALLVVRGHNIVNKNLKVALHPPTGVMVMVEPVTDALASHDGDYLAFSVTAHVDTALATDVALDVVVTQDGSQANGCVTDTQTMAAALTLHGLPELTSASPEVNLAANPKTVTFPLSQPMYSKVDLVTGVTVPLSFVSPSARAEITSVSSIQLADVNASSTGTSSGPGGFSAGATPGPGVGTTGGDSALLGNGGGGGGAGFATVGATGIKKNGAGGTGGAVYGEDRILSLDANRPSAGGTGGSGLVLLGGLATKSAGSLGGGGGGMVLLTAGGDIATGTVTSGGGPGGTPASAGGPGGGGAGGVVVAHSQSGTITATALRVPGGAQPGSTGGEGTGSVGRTRWDAPAGTVSSPDRPAYRGPAFQQPARVVAAAGQTFMVNGAPGDALQVLVVDQSNAVHTGDLVTLNNQGTATITPTLFGGLNQLCIKINVATGGGPTTQSCVPVVLLP